MFPILRLLCVTLVLTGCSAPVTTDYDTHINYAQFKTYQFAPGHSSYVISLDDSRVEDAISVQLHSKGLKPGDNADLTVKHYILQHSDFQSYGTSVGLGYGYRHVGVAYSTPIRYRQYTYGKLIVELIDNQSNQIVWRAVSQRKLTENMTPSSRQAFIDEQVFEMFKNYPPS